MGRSPCRAGAARIVVGILRGLVIASDTCGHQGPVVARKLVTSCRILAAGAMQQVGGGGSSTSHLQVRLVLVPCASLLVSASLTCCLVDLEGQCYFQRPPLGSSGTVHARFTGAIAVSAAHDTCEGSSFTAAILRGSAVCTADCRAAADDDHHSSVASKKFSGSRAKGAGVSDRCSGQKIAD